MEGDQMGDLDPDGVSGKAMGGYGGEDKGLSSSSW